MPIFNLLIEKLKSNLILVLILAVAATIRLYHLDESSLWYDELHSASLSDPQWSFFDTLDWYIPDINDNSKLYDATPPLHNFILRCFNLVFGYNDFNIRLFSVIISLASIISIYKLSKELFDKNSALLCCFILSFNFYHIEYSIEARAYMLFLLTTSLSFYFLLKCVSTNNTKYHLLFSITNALVLYTHYYSFFYFISLIFIFVIIIYKKFNLQIFYKFLLGFALTFILYSPWIFSLNQHLKVEQFWIQSPQSDFFKDIFFYFFGANHFVATIIFISILVFLASIINSNFETKNKESVFICLIFILVSLVVPYVKSLISIPLIQTRYLIFILWVPILLFSVFIQKFWTNNIAKVLFVIIFISLSVCSLFFPNKYYIKQHNQNWRENTQFIVQNNQNNDKVVCQSNLVNHYYFKLFSPNTNLVQYDYNNIIDELIERKSILENKAYSIWAFYAPYGKPMNDETQTFLDLIFDISTTSDASKKCYSKLYNFDHSTLIKPIINSYIYSKEILHNTNIDLCKVYKKMLFIQGWAFYNDYSVPSEFYVLLKSKNTSHVIKCQKQVRKDLNNSNNSNDLSNSGFFVFADLQNIPKGNYNIEILLSDKKNVKIGFEPILYKNITI